MNEQTKQQIAEIEALLEPYYDLETLEPIELDLYPELVDRLVLLRSNDGKNLVIN